jgi:hypothetical protein
MSHQAALEERAEPAAPECRHHWLIESPHGATSWGACKVCGERREFSNSASDALWEGGGVPTRKGEPITSYGARIGSSSEDDEGF